MSIGKPKGDTIKIPAILLFFFTILIISVSDATQFSILISKKIGSKPELIIEWTSDGKLKEGVNIYFFLLIYFKYLKHANNVASPVVVRTTDLFFNF